MDSTAARTSQPALRAAEALGYRSRHAAVPTARGVARVAVAALPASATRNRQVGVPSGEVCDFTLLVDRRTDGSVAQVRTAGADDLADIARRMAASTTW